MKSRESINIHCGSRQFLFKDIERSLYSYFWTATWTRKDLQIFAHSDIIYIPSWVWNVNQNKPTILNLVRWAQKCNRSNREKYVKVGEAKIRTASLEIMWNVCLLKTHLHPRPIQVKSILKECSVYRVVCIVQFGRGSKVAILAYSVVQNKVHISLL